MVVGVLFLMLASANGDEVLAVPEAPNGPLVCRYETFVSRLILRRKMCLTQAEWQKRESENSEAARKSVYEVMGNTDCSNGGICTQD